MQRHAFALGYFFLAAFCALASPHSYVELRLPFLIAAAVAILVGIGYVAGPLLAHLRAFQAWLANMIRLAQQPTTRIPSMAEEKHIQ